MSASKTPALTQRLNQRWTALLEPNWGGRSFHLAPLSSIQKTPASALRLARAGRPPRGSRTGSGIRSHNQSSSASLICNMQIYTFHRQEGLGIASSLGDMPLVQLRALAATKP